MYVTAEKDYSSGDVVNYCVSRLSVTFQLNLPNIAGFGVKYFQGLVAARRGGAGGRRRGHEFSLRAPAAAVFSLFPGTRGTHASGTDVFFFVQPKTGTMYIMLHIRGILIGASAHLLPQRLFQHTSFSNPTISRPVVQRFFWSVFVLDVLSRFGGRIWEFIVVDDAFN